MPDQLRTGDPRDDLLTRWLAWTGRRAPKSPVSGPVRTIEPCRTTKQTLGSLPRSEEQGPETSGSPGDPTQVFQGIEIRVFEPGNKGNLHSQPNLPTRPRDVSSTPKSAETSRGFAVRPVRAPRPALASTSYAESVLVLTSSRCRSPDGLSSRRGKSLVLLRASRLSLRQSLNLAEPQMVFRALATLRRMQRGSLVSPCGSDEPSADHSSRSIRIIL